MSIIPNRFIKFDRKIYVLINSTLDDNDLQVDQVVMNFENSTQSDSLEEKGTTADANSNSDESDSEAINETGNVEKCLLISI